MKKWLDIVGIGESGMESLSVDAKLAVGNADVIVGAKRHCEKIENEKAKKIMWSSPFDAGIKNLKKYREQKKQVVVLATGDPLWYSVGGKIVEVLGMRGIRIHPQLSSFQLAASRLGWNMSECETLTVHGRADESVRRYICPRNRLLILTQNKNTPKKIAEILCGQGFENSKMIVLSHLGSSQEKKFIGMAKQWKHKVPDFHVLAVECEAGQNPQWNASTIGMDDEAFVHDGQITKQNVRAITIAQLAPFPNAVLWDVGAGCGSISIEWMNAAHGAVAIAIEKNKKRIKMIEKNAQKFGMEKLQIHSVEAPKQLDKLPMPDAIFIGGGLGDKNVFEKLWEYLPAKGRMVVNGVIVDSEMKLIELQKKYGGKLQKFQMQEMDKIGSKDAWGVSRQITQWVVVKGAKRK